LHHPFAVTVPPELAPVRPGEELDWNALSAYLQANLPQLSGEMEVLVRIGEDPLVETTDERMATRGDWITSQAARALSILDQ
jgi:hypothetical protein